MVAFEFVQIDSSLFFFGHVLAYFELVYFDFFSFFCLNISTGRTGLILGLGQRQPEFAYTIGKVALPSKTTPGYRTVVNKLYCQITHMLQEIIIFLPRVICTYITQFICSTEVISTFLKFLIEILLCWDVFERKTINSSALLNILWTTATNVIAKMSFQARIFFCVKQN